MKKALPFLALTACGFAAGSCAPEAPKCYSPDDCQHCYCLGPAQVIANAPVRPVTCDGDLSITVAGLYWKASQDGMEYAIDNAVKFDNFNSVPEIRENNNLVDAKYLHPSFDWDFGFKLGISYSSPCDGWDTNVLWTSFGGSALSHVEAEATDNHTLLALWSAFQSIFAGSGPLTGVLVSDIQTSWKFETNMIDLTLGREFWVSKYLSIRPYTALRSLSLMQKYHLEHKGREFSNNNVNRIADMNNEVDIENDYKGVGLLGGLYSFWHLGCGWSLYGNTAASIIYGKFDIDHVEQNREATSPFTKTRILETKDHFRASRAILDLELGIAYSALICGCKYGLTAQLGWEEHLFFHQNQMWRVNRQVALNTANTQNNDGVNDFEQRRGTLATQGLTLTFRFDF